MPDILDLFCGVGGFSLGATRAGFNLVGGIDLDHDAMKMHGVNFPGTSHWETDILKLTGTEILQKFGIEHQLDGLIGGPPCQGFSRMGHQKVTDTRNSLFVKFFNLVAEIKPKFFLAENVLGILDAKNQPIVDNSLDIVKKDYTVLPPLIIKASDYGVPTTRTRVFFYGYQPDKVRPLTMDMFVALPNTGVVHVEDALVGLPTNIKDDWRANPSGWLVVPPPHRRSYFFDRVRGCIPNGVGDKSAIYRMRTKHEISGNQGTVHSCEVRARYASIVAGDVDAKSKSKRLKLNGFCHTIRAGTGRDHGSFQAVRPIHPTEDRVITPREAARLQSFPDWFQFYPTKWHSFRQIGNSVCPILAEKILKLIYDAIIERKVL